MSRVYYVGSNQIPLVIAVDDVGPVSGLTITAKILRMIDGLQWDFSDNTFKDSGDVVTPTVALTESAVQPGLYTVLWNSTSVITPMDVVAIYQSTADEVFIQDDQITFIPNTSDEIFQSFMEAVVDASQKTMTMVFGLSNNLGLLFSQAAVVHVYDELGTVILTANTVSTTGLHRKVFPNVRLIPNRIITVSVDFSVSSTVYTRVMAIKVLGVEV